MKTRYYSDGVNYLFNFPFLIHMGFYFWKSKGEYLAKIVGGELQFIHLDP